MINPVGQSYTTTTSGNLNVNKTENKQTKADQTQKMENDKASKISEQIKNGVYKIDLGKTAVTIADSLI